MDLLNQEGLDLTKFFERFDARAIDPEETIEIDGRSRRVIDVYKATRRKVYNKRYRDKDRVADRARTAEWKRTHSNEVKAQKHRTSDRNYHRPFVGIDAEGQDFGGEPVRDVPYFMLEGDIEYRGNIYPLHRTILWAAGGWQRIYNSTELANGIGLPTLGKETPWYHLGYPDKRMLGSIDIIEWLLDLPSKYDKAHGFPHGVNFGAYAFNYDVTQILADFPRDKVWEITRRRSWETRKRIRAPVLMGDYAFDYLKSKWLKIWRLRDPDHPMKEKLDGDGNVKLRPNGKPVMEIDHIGYICIEDAFGFYQSRFTKAIKPLVSQKYIEKKDYDEIEYMKEHRDEFDQLKFDDILHYCHRELVCLSKALTVLRDGFDRMGNPGKPLRVPTWTGAGSPAGALIRNEELKKKHYSPDITVNLENMTSQQNHSHYRFIGERIEPLMQGYAMQRILWLYDIVSAYPSALVLLPSMRDGEWRFHGAFASQKEAEQAALNTNILDGFRVKWNFPTWSKQDNRGVPWYPFGYRTKRKSILFPSSGHAWITRDELVAGFEWARRFNCEDCFTVEEWDEFIPGNGDKPYAFVAELFEMRRQAKRKTEYDIVELAIKLVLNSLYGKTVQSVGGDEENPPSCACPYYGSTITGHCRARLIKAALLDPYAVVNFMTDGIVSTRELKGLPNAKEVFNGQPPEGVDLDLGDWEFEEMAGGFFLQSGVYCLVHKNGETKDKTRGSDPRNFILRMPLKELMLERVLPEWKDSPDPDKPSRYTLDIEIKNYVTAASAAASDERFKLIGRWSETIRTIDVHNLGTKRGLILNFPEFYFSGKPHKGVIDRRIIERTADVLGMPFKEVAQCYRSGEALRCRFLVPSIPAKNETPEELSLPSYPEWLDPDYEEDDNEGSPWELTDQDRDTSEILIGRS